MMTQEELKSRIEKKEAQIAKVEKRIAKWSKGMPQEAIDKCAACELVWDDPKQPEATAEWKRFSKEHPELKDQLYNPHEWNKGPQYDELRRAYWDLAENKATLHKYHVALDKVINFENEEKIEVIWNFLQNIRQQNYDYFVENANLYSNLIKNESKEFDLYKTNNEDEFKDLSWNQEFHKECDWKSIYYENIHTLTKNEIAPYGRLDLNRLNKILDDDLTAKYKDLVHRITEKAGQIQDASGLFIGDNGNINGIVIGDKNKVKVETIGAGGYNIQIFHYRTLVNIVK